MEIRRVRSDDREALKGVRLAALQDAPHAFGSTYAEECERGDDWWHDWAQKSADARDQATFLAFEAGRCVGMVAGFASTPGSAKLVAMWVAPEARRLGVGTALVHAVVSWVAITGRRRVVLWVADGNVAASRLYASLGFRPTGEATQLRSHPEVRVVQLERVVGQDA